VHDVGSRVAANLGLAHTAAAPFLRRYPHIADDLLGEAQCVLVRCCATYDPDRGALSSLVYTAVRWRLRQVAASWAGPVGVPTERCSAGAEATRAAPPAIDDDGCEVPLVELLVDPRLDPEQEAMRHELPEEVLAELGRLDPRSRDVVLARACGVPLRTLAEPLGITVERVRQIQRRALDRLRE
jgi:RNA polymerase sigma factor (sigma-70 family)